MSSSTILITSPSPLPSRTHSFPILFCFVLFCFVLRNARVPFSYCFYYFEPGHISIEPFVIGSFLSVFHHSLFPVHFSIVMVSWFLQLCLILYSVLPSATPSVYITNTILIIFFMATIILNYRIHTSKLMEFIQIHKAMEEKRKVEEEEMKMRVIGEYLADAYVNHTPSTGEDTIDDDRH